MNTINMQDMRHLNLFNQITKIRTRFCIKYNDTIIFCVPKEFVIRAVGEGGKNVKKISEILGKKIRVIPSPKGIHNAKQFIENIVRPLTFKDLEIKDDEIILTAGIQNKAALIGRNKRRLIELKKIVKDFFGKDLRIV